MSKYRRVTERLEVQTAQRRRGCGHNPAHSIAKGERCLFVRSATSGGDSYCRPCAIEMLREGVQNLQELEQEIS